MKVSCILNFNGDIHVEGVNLGNVRELQSFA